MTALAQQSTELADQQVVHLGLVTAGSSHSPRVAIAGSPHSARVATAGS